MIRDRLSASTYTSHILRPILKICLLFCFCTGLAGTAYGTEEFKQEQAPIVTVTGEVGGHVINVYPSLSIGGRAAYHLTRDWALVGAGRTFNLTGDGLNADLKKIAFGLRRRAGSQNYWDATLGISRFQSTAKDTGGRYLDGLSQVILESQPTSKTTKYTYICSAWQVAFNAFQISKLSFGAAFSAEIGTTMKFDDKYVLFGLLVHTSLGI